MGKALNSWATKAELEIIANQMREVDPLVANPVFESNYEMASARMKFVQFRPDASSNCFLYSYQPGIVRREAADTNHSAAKRYQI